MQERSTFGYKKLLNDRYSKIYIILGALCVAITLIMMQRNENFVSIRNFISMGHQMAMIALIAFAVTTVIIVKCTDLSTGANMGLAAMVGALAAERGLPAGVCIILMIASGTLGGAINGFLIAYMDISPFIVTFAMQQFFRGIIVTISDASSVKVENEALLWLGTGEFLGIPISIFLTFAFLGIWWFIMRKTMYGRYIYATGGNFEAARASGINARFIQFSTLVMTGFMCGVASILYIGRVNTAQPTAGMGMEFDVLTAVFVGGAVIAGGSGRPVGALLGTLLVTIIKTAMNFFGVPQFISYVVTGSFILLAVVFYQANLFVNVKNIVKKMFQKKSKIQASKGVTDFSSQNHSLELRGIGKTFASFKALQNVSATIKSGEIVGLMGENGAGKSTLVNVMSGVFPQTEGEIFVDGEKINFFSPQDSKDIGIGVIHQHYSLIPELTIAQNLFYNQEPRFMGIVRRKLMNKRAAQLMKEFDLDIPVETKVYQLTVGQKQLLEVVKATIKTPWLLIMDEPTSSLSKTESERLYELIDRVHAKNVAIIYISHKMAEIFKLCKRAWVLRDGQLVSTVADLSEVTEKDLINMMIGRNIENIFPYTEAERGNLMLSVKGLSDGNLLKDINFDVHRGETVVLAGLMGAGRTESVECICGLRKIQSGSIEIEGKNVTPKPNEMLKYKIGFVPEDRHTQGIIPHMTIADNISLVWNRLNSKYGIVQAKKEKVLIDDMIKTMNVRPNDPKKETIYLSGGNQQKVVLGKNIAVSPEIFILDDPTRGVDVGAKSEIHNVIAKLKKSGAAVLMISSELPEVLNVADRIYVIHNGRTVKELAHGTTEAEVMHYAFNLPAEDHKEVV